MPVSGAILIALLTAIFASEFGGYLLAAPISAALLLVFYATEWIRMRKVARIFVAGGASMTIFAFLSDEPIELIRKGLEAGAFLTAFIASLAGMRAMADRSAMVRRCGRQLMSQPPGKRYLALAFGGSVFGVIINIGALNLLGSMLRQSVSIDDPDKKIAAIHRATLQRSLIAVLRGFSTSLLWSPLSISVALVLKSLPGIEWPELIGAGALVAFVSIMFGWLVDRLFERDPKATAKIGQTGDGWTVHWFPALLIFSVFIMAATIESLSGVALIVSVMASVPIVTFGWMVVQERGATISDTIIRSARRGTDIICDILPDYRNEMVIVSTAAYAGAIISYFLTPELVAELLTKAHIPAMAFPAIVIAIVLLGGLAGLNAIVTVTILATALPNPEAFGVPTIILGLVHIYAWGLTVASSPVAMSTLILGALTRESGATVGLKWNGLFTLLAWIVSSIIFGALVVIIGV